MRFEHWERRLNAILDMYRRRPFEWGRCDCALFAADCAWALTQRDPALAWRRTYDSEEGANALIAKAGGLFELVEIGLASAGIVADRLKPSFGQRGDPCLVESEEGVVGLGAVVAGGVAVKNTDGLRLLPLSAARMLWAIR